MNLSTAIILLAGLFQPVISASLLDADPNAIACRVNVSSESEIEAYLRGGLYSADLDATLRYKTIYAWNTVGIEVSGSRNWTAINVRIYPSSFRARITMDIPDYSTSATFYLTADGELTSSDGSMVFTCR